MKRYTESYVNLYHGTTEEAALEIVRSQKFLPSDGDNWCGAGIYFYDNKTKALWVAKRKCEQIRRISGERCGYTYVNADIINIDREEVLNLRSFQGLEAFERFVDHILKECNFTVAGDEEEHEKIVKKRAILISLFCNEYGKKLVIGHFRQAPRSDVANLHIVAETWELVIGVETIYCVKEDTVIQNIRGVSQ